MNETYEDKKRLKIIVEELIQQLETSNVGVRSANGEWAWLNENKRKDYVESLYTQNWTLLQSFLLNPLSEETAYGMVTPASMQIDDSNMESEDFKKDVELFNSLYPTEKSDVLNHEPLLAHPFSTTTESMHTYPDSPRHAHFAKEVIKKVSDNSIGVEIGGGYGGLIHFLIKFGYKGKIIDCDLLESLLIAYIFLRFYYIDVTLCLTKEELISANQGECKVILITPELFFSLTEFENITFVFNSRSLSEMSSESCLEYMRITNSKIRPKYFFSENAEFVLFPDSQRHLENTQDEISQCLKNFHLIDTSKSQFMGGSNRYTMRLHKLIGSD